MGFFFFLFVNVETECLLRNPRMCKATKMHICIASLPLLNHVGSSKGPKWTIFVFKPGSQKLLEPNKHYSSYMFMIIVNPVYLSSTWVWVVWGNCEMFVRGLFTVLWYVWKWNTMVNLLKMGTSVIYCPTLFYLL